MNAAAFPDKSAVELLIEKKASLDIQNKYKETALILAARSGYKNICSVLVLAKANVHIQDDEGKTAADWASERGDDLAHLYDNGKLGLLSGSEALSNLIKNVDPSLWKVRFVLRMSLDLFFRLHRLHLGTWLRLRQMVMSSKIEALLDLGFDIDVQNARCSSALTAAAFRGRTSVIQLLLRRQASLHARTMTLVCALLRSHWRPQVRV